ncbi:MAG: RNA polymerase sigma factor [bacterium]|nr:RNA polymerase sigma factor [bacterium]MDT8365403.1 RNA polymerase sigma factor [bacterium]
MDEIKDETVAERAAAGDISAFEDLVDRHRMAVYRLARSVTGNHHDADDAAQETFLRVYRALGSFDSSRSFKPWLKRIAYNTSLNTVRASKSRARGIVDGDFPEVADPSPRQLETMEANQSATSIDHAVQTLPSDLRATLLLRAVEGMSYKDIAMVMGVKIGTVMSRLSRARERVLEVLEPAGSVAQRGEKR